MSLPADIAHLNTYVTNRINRYPDAFSTLFELWLEIEELHKNVIIQDFIEYHEKVKYLTSDVEITLLLNTESSRLKAKYSLYI